MPHCGLAGRAGVCRHGRGAAKHNQAEQFKQRELSAPDPIKNSLSALRAEIQEKKLQHGVGYTTILDQPRSTRLGDVDDPQQTKEWRMNVNQQAERLLKVDEEDRVGFLLQDPGRRNTLPDVARQKEVNCNASLRAFDWRTYGKVSPVRRQVCGNCWAFAAVAAYEASYLIRNNQTEDGSEQYINDCSRTNSGAQAGSCEGGTGIERARAHRARGRHYGGDRPV
jgi:cathepsin L